MHALLLLPALLGCRETLSSTAAFDREAPKAWEALLAEIVDERGLVRYDHLEKHRAPLDAYVAWLGSERAWGGRMTKDWHAQYLNAYNALVLYQVLERKRPASVLDVRGIVPIAGFKFFHFTQFPLGAETLTLSEIEHERVRWKEMDYRDHAALNCASMACPPLRAELYKPAALETQLDDQMRRWLSDPERGVRVQGEGAGAKAIFNPIFDWYERDFAFFSAGVDPCGIASRHVDDDETRRKLKRLSEAGCPREFFAYDWSLNAAR